MPYQQRISIAILRIFAAGSMTMKTAKRIRLITFLTASLFAAAISFSHVSPTHGDETEKATLNTTDAHSEASGDLVPLKLLSVHSLSLPAPFSLRTNIVSCFLFNIFSPERPAEAVTEDLSRSPDVFFEIVFTFFISPNAP